MPEQSSFFHRCAARRSLTGALSYATAAALLAGAVSTAAAPPAEQSGSSSIQSTFTTDLQQHAALPLGPVQHVAATEGLHLGTEDFWSFTPASLSEGWSASVNTFTGNLVLSGLVTEVSSRGPALSEALTYNSQSTADAGLGAGWVLASGQALVENSDGSVTWRDEDGTRHTFTKNTSGGFVSPPGLHLKLSLVSTGVYTLTDSALTRSRFEGGRVVSVTDEKGNTLTHSYDTSNRLTALTDAGGRKLTYGYDTSGRLTSVTDPASQVVKLGYDSAGRLSTVTDAAGGVSTIGYDSAGRATSYTDAKGAVTKFGFNTAGQIAKVTDPRSTATTEIATGYAYDTTTSTTTITDPAGAGTKVVHNAAGNPTATTDASGVTVDVSWTNNEPTTVTDAAGSASATYDAAGNVTATSETLTSTTSAKTTTSYDTRNNPLAHTDPNGTRVDLRYDAESNLTSEALPVRREADANTYDAHGNVTTETDPGAASASLVRNGSFERVDATGKPVAWTPSGPAVSVDTTTARFGTKSLKISSTTTTTAWALSDLAPVTAGQLVTLSASANLATISGTGVTSGVEFYDSAGTSLGKTYTNLYTGTGLVPLRATATAPTGAVLAAAVVELRSGSGTVHFDGVQVETALKNDEGHLLTAFDYVNNSSFEFGSSDWYAGGPAGAATVVDTAAWGGVRSGQIVLTTASTAWLVSDTIPVTAGEQLTLSGYLKTASVTGGGARLQVQYVDSTGAVLGTAATSAGTGTRDWTRYAIPTAAPTGAVSATVMAVLNNGTGTVHADNVKLAPRATTSYSYDATGTHLTREVDPLGAVSSHTYDAVGNLTSTTDPAGGVTKIAYDADNRPTTVTDPAGGITRYGYDLAGNGVVMRDARSASATDNTYATRYGYDPAQRRTSITDPLGRVTGYEHDKPGRLAKVANPSGTSVAYTYTAAGRPQKETLSSGSSYSYAYDPGTGALTSVTRSSGTEADLGYAYTYDAAHRLTTQTDPWGYKQTYTLDPAGQVTAITDSDGKAVRYTYGADGRTVALTDTGGRTSSVRYDESGRPFEIFLGDGSKGEITYDAVGRPVAAGHSRGATLYYQYDTRGNVVAISSPAGKDTYTYDALSRLTSWTAPNGVKTDYAYDATGNLTRKGDKTYTHDAAGQITNTGFTHDADGRLTSNGVHTYAYDGAGRLTKVTKVADGSTVAAYRYDHRGLRIEKTTASGTIRYSWNDAEQLIRETDGTGKVLARYTWMTDNRLAAIEKNGAMYYPHTNARGDVMAITDATGTRVAAYNYGPWGELLSTTGTFTQPWRYAGYYADDDTGLYYLQQRYYSPTLARFLTKEPMFSDFCTDCGFQALLDSAPTTSPYAYADNRPLTFVDPDGRKPWYRKAGGWVSRNRGSIATGAALGGCLIPGAGWAACGALQAGALAARSSQRASTGGGWKKTARASVADGVFTAGTFGLGRVPVTMAKYGGMGKPVWNRRGSETAAWKAIAGRSTGMQRIARNAAAGSGAALPGVARGAGCGYQKWRSGRACG
jgi:RHS repeat-associated protein